MIKTTKIKMQWEGDYSVHVRNSISGNPPETWCGQYKNIRMGYDHHEP